MLRHRGLEDSRSRRLTAWELETSYTSPVPRRLRIVCGIYSVSREQSVSHPEAKLHPRQRLGLAFALRAAREPSGIEMRVSAERHHFILQAGSSTGLNGLDWSGLAYQFASLSGCAKATPATDFAPPTIRPSLAHPLAAPSCDQSPEGIRMKHRRPLGSKRKKSPGRHFS